jgi:shikimate kinase
MQRVFLIGFMGAGKTTIGQELSVRMNCSFVDLDLFIERRYYKTIRQIFEEKGEETFREIECKALREVAEFEDVVISTGGGTPCFHQNMMFMNEQGTTVYLKVSLEELVRRINLHKSARPLLKDYTGDELRRFVEESIVRRRPFYEQAHIVFSTDTLDMATGADLMMTDIPDHLIRIVNSLNES